MWWKENMPTNVIMTGQNICKKLDRRIIHVFCMNLPHIYHLPCIIYLCTCWFLTCWDFKKCHYGSSISTPIEIVKFVVGLDYVDDVGPMDPSN